ncbi:hypothetical protein EYF80_063597 [Liparis tanakae]|uniref:Uncharacterized protein n=1 Tax=Liparis tanakae TaxID=230148 RepID=A0A4Z2EBQ3_9TELE|nr:hypothetical protein EYF80_063597 [Liparis tanakae]
MGFSNPSASRSFTIT